MAFEQRIVIEKGDGPAEFAVLVDDKWFADGLCLDECLGLLASALYGSGHPQFAVPVRLHTRTGADLILRERHRERGSA